MPAKAKSNERHFSADEVLALNYLSGNAGSVGKEYEARDALARVLRGDSIEATILARLAGLFENAPPFEQRKLVLQWRRRGEHLDQKLQLQIRNDLLYGLDCRSQMKNVVDDIMKRRGVSRATVLRACKEFKRWMSEVFEDESIKSTRWQTLLKSFK